MNISDKTIAQAREGNKEAFANLYDTFARPVYDFLYFRTFDQARAEDLTADTFMKVLKSIGTFKGTTAGELKSWIYTIAYHTFVDSVRSDRPQEDLEDHIDTRGTTPDYASQIDASERLARVLEYLDTLGPPTRDIILMAVWDDLRYGEIAAITGLSLANIKKIISRTLPKIAANVAALLPVFFLFN